MLAGNNRRLIINIPPRYMKSIICSVALPAFILGHNPKATVICVSYSDDLSLKFANDCRNVMESDWYKDMFPGTCISKSRRSVADFETTKNGGRLSTSVAGTLTGRGADFYDWNGDINHKFLPEDIYNQIIESKNALCPEYKLFTKTSCSISHLLNNFDANLNFIKRNYSCSVQCPNGSICKSYQPRYTDNEREILKKFNLLDCANFIDGVLYINKPISQELKAFLTQTIKLRIIVPETLKSHTEGIFNARNGRSL